jgi:outer membrane protein OmpA-like peptidoglycan-associated protein
MKESGKDLIKINQQLKRIEIKEFEIENQIFTCMSEFHLLNICVICEKKGRLNNLNESAEMEIEKMGYYLKKIELSEIVIGKSIKIENIYFDLDKYNIRSDAAIELDKIVNLMKNNPNLIIEIGSHTDCRFSSDYNMKLSNNRAKSSVDYIISNGISKSRISAKGYGETMLVNDCKCEGAFDVKACNEEQHQANRRTEFKITGLLKDKNTTILNNGMGNSPKSVPLPKN